MRKLGLAALFALFVLHQDFWLWSRDTFVLGYPVGLTYHVALCGAAVVVFWWLTRLFLPDQDGVEQP